ncbi:MAG: CDP-glucose 4,6-dehydratase [Candidatus Velthaea sp.]|jgi:CDP-glucose 4,6-dehydratase
MKAPTAAFWAGRRVLITGHSGFKGSWLAFWLSKLGARVTGFALPPSTKPAAFTAMNIEKRIDSQFGDIRDERALRDVFAAAQPEVVFHLAAQATVRAAHLQPVETFDVNVMGTVRLLDAIRQTPSVRAVLVVTSDKCYAERASRQRPYVEADSLGGSEPYAASKACAEIVTLAYRQAFLAEGNVRVATARAGNVIGGGDWTACRLVTDLVRALKAGHRLELRYPRATRPWQHVLEPLCGYLLLAEQLANGRRSYARAWNFGPDCSDVTSVEEFVARFEHAWGAVAARVVAATPGPPEALYLSLDSGLARRELGWRCRLTLDEAIDWTVRWYQSAHCERDANDITDAQIQQYLVAPEIALHAASA